MKGHDRSAGFQPAPCADRNGRFPTPEEKGGLETRAPEGFRRRLDLALATALAILAGPAIAADARAGETPVPLDAERMVDGVGVGCTGIGQTRLDPRWRAFSVRIEFSNPAKEYLANEGVAVFDASGRRLVAVTCEGPWILFKLPPGSYRAEGWLPGREGADATGAVRVPARGQALLVLRFP